MTRAAAAAISATERRLARALHPADPEPGTLFERDADPRLAIAVAERHGVDALLADTLTRAGLVARLPDDARESLRDAAFRRHAAQAELSTAAGAALDAFGRAGIECLALKGAALAGTHYASPAHRPMNDVDLLVRRRDVEPAVAALRESGFSVPGDDVRAFWDAAYYHLPVRAPGAASVLVELHWGVAQADRHPVDVEALFARAVPCAVAGRDAAALEPLDTLVHLSLHHAYHFFEPRLVWILDRVLVARSLAGQGAEEALWERARAWGATIPLALAARQVQGVFPGALPRELAALGRRGVRARALAALCGSREPVALLRGWSRRPVQLAYGVLMIDDPRRALAALTGWITRARRFGDRAGRRRAMSEGDAAAVLASAPGGDRTAREPAQGRGSDDP